VEGRKGKDRGEWDHRGQDKQRMQVKVRRVQGGARQSGGDEQESVQRSREEGVLRGRVDLAGSRYDRRGEGKREVMGRWGKRRTEQRARVGCNRHRP
jgi:hypothetical protein